MTLKVRHGKVDKRGAVTLRSRDRVHHIGIGAPYKGWRVIMLVAGLDIQVIGLDGSPLRHLRLDPTKDYHPRMSKTGFNGGVYDVLTHVSPMSRDTQLTLTPLEELSMSSGFGPTVTICFGPTSRQLRQRVPVLRFAA